MNPLDMTGPEFLRFYLAYGLCGLALAGLLRMLWNRGIAANAELRWTPGYYPSDSEAYGIALLRGGPREAARALLSRLLAEGFVDVEHGEVRKTEKAQDPSGLDPLERQVLQSLAPRQSPGQAESLIEGRAGTALAEMERGLERQGLVPPKDARNRLLGLCGLALLAVPGLGVLKLMVAVSRGRFNVGFLLILLVVYTAALLALLLPPRRTAAGRRYLSWLQDSHKGLRNLLASGRREGAGEMALAAGIFGLSALPLLASLSYADEPPRRREPESGGSCSSGGGYGGDSGSAGGGDSGGGGDGGGGDGGGSGCGGGDGGGGCGGGCGGCGSG